MPILWRYLLKRYFQVFSLCVLSFVGVLLVFRFQTIARFAASGTHIWDVLLFTLFQIPYILPIAIPISCLISSMLLLQSLSNSHEITAFRTSGLSLKPILVPILLAGFCLFLLNLTISCEISPRSRILAKKLVYEALSNNPLIVFQKDGLLKVKGAYIEMKKLENGKYAEDVVFLSQNKSNERLSLVIAKKLSLKKELLRGEKVAMISSADSKQGEGFDHLMIENQDTMDAKGSHLMQFTQTPSFGFSDEQQTLKQLLAKERAHHSKVSMKTFVEMAKRGSIAFAAFTFTLIGVSFGLHIGRLRSKRGILFAVSLAAFYMISFIAAKSFKNSYIAILLLTIPHLIIIFSCLKPLSAVTRGVET